MMNIRRKILGILCASAVIAGAHAQDYPNRTIRIITPYNPGSMVDTTTRMVAEAMSKKLGQPIVVENRMGGMGSIALTALRSAPADGYTLMTDTPASAINPSLYSYAKYNPKTDIAPIAQFMKLPFVMAVNPAVKANSATELIGLIRSNPAQINVAVAGTSTGLVGDMFAQMNGVKFSNINYKGAGNAVLAVLGNECQVIFLDVANLAEQINGKKLVGLLVTGEQRSSVIKEVPTAREAGYGQFQESTWFGMFTKAGVPQDVQEKLNQVVREVMADPKMQEYLEAHGGIVSNMTLSEFHAFYDNEVDRWAKAIKDANLQQNNHIDGKK